MVSTRGSGLPPGQSEGPMRRFGLPHYARIRPVVPERPVLVVGGTVRRPVQIDVSELFSSARRVDQVSDLHCVTTWSATGLRWSGVLFRDVHELLAGRVRPHPSCAWVVFTGLDGYRSCMALSDALAGDVQLADRLGGEPLAADHGAPLRLVAPAHYGYKSVRHLCAVEYRTRYDPGSARWAAHRRGRVAREERSTLLPGWVWRRIWRRAAPGVRAAYDRAGED
ncbi:molybdopterin-dependent oxidoreductase [Saccharopolyspora erythraea]|uniref:Molybdopterin-binding oxidoreductase n=2 Tax=Saccharopolyspora erythraea TaxID=1836 RepID=A4FEX2_SACEN|nr:molybdopterin-dependent oxidoreductase [Saccharopolyspora erythraea]EQD82781.1 molybdopterin-binding oxidoreductase [Saccharopolyspora erythraea D]QRK92840.1 molybdopterin-dependent oxidoreductase [Saccharopolyspora erythraea]CAM02597.1 molybdopterin-binding oxidoreductase [Saccharopolyspora erythraea NRRL 2338]